ncbi:MAG: hypothetical protein U0790_25615 [Isosphaeraceae bacterium]
MSQPELLRRVVAVLNDLRIDYMLTGSMASSLHGGPRSTHDIDLVVALRPEYCDPLYSAFDPSAFYLSRSAIAEALAHGRMFNLLEYADGDKVDFWILTDEPFDRSRFARKRLEKFLGMRVNVSTPEDTILAKLRWAMLSGGSQKQLADARSILDLQGDSLDTTYIETWAREIGVESLWDRIRSESEHS